MLGFESSEENISSEDTESKVNLSMLDYKIEEHSNGSLNSLNDLCSKLDFSVCSIDSIEK